MWLEFSQNGIAGSGTNNNNIVTTTTLLQQLVYCYRGAYSSSTVPGSKPFNDGLEIAVSTHKLTSKEIR